MNVRALIAALPLFLAACSGPERLLPDALGGMNRVAAVVGDEAQDRVDKLHGKTVAPDEVAVGEYAGSDGKATLYVSAYRSPLEAGEIETRMTMVMRKGGSPFTGVRERQVNGRSVKTCTGFGQVHFLFSWGDNLYWLASDPAAADEAVSALVLATARPS